MPSFGISDVSPLPAEPATKRLVVFARYPEQIGDHQQGEGFRVGVAEFHLAPVRQLVDESIREAIDELFILLEPIRCEEPAGQRAMPRVRGRVERGELVAHRNLVTMALDGFAPALAWRGLW